MSAYANTRKKTLLEIHFISLGNREIYCILRHAAQSLFYFPQNSVSFIILSFSVQIILMFSTNHALKFQYQPSHLKVQLPVWQIWNYSTYPITGQNANICLDYHNY